MKKFVCVFLLVVFGGCAGKNRILTGEDDATTSATDFEITSDMGMNVDAFIPQDVNTQPRSCNGTATQVDILFVVDNSGGMAQEQQNLRENFCYLIDALRSHQLGPEPGKENNCTEFDTSGCKIPDVHIGVISSDLGAGDYRVPSCEKINGDGGKLQNTPSKAGCKPPSDPWISYNNGTTNVPGSTTYPPEHQVCEALSCIAELGTDGCGFEQPLEAARWALDPEKNINPGFLRKGALLVVIFVTDEDDCSANNTELYNPAQQQLTDPLGPLTSFRCFEFGVLCDGQPVDRHKIGPLQNCEPAGDYLYKVEDYVSFFASLDSGGGVILAAIAGPVLDENGNSLVSVTKEDGQSKLAPSCSTVNLGSAYPAIRIKKVIEAFEAVKMGSFDNICDGNFGPAFVNISPCVGN